MPTRNVSLTKVLDQLVAKKVATGRYENASEVVRAALRALDREEREYEARLSALKKALAEGQRSGTFEGDPFESVRAELALKR